MENWRVKPSWGGQHLAARSGGGVDLGQTERMRNNHKEGYKFGGGELREERAVEPKKKKTKKKT